MQISCVGREGRGQFGREGPRWGIHGAHRGRPRRERDEGIEGRAGAGRRGQGPALGHSRSRWGQGLISGLLGREEGRKEEAPDPGAGGLLAAGPAVQASLGPTEGADGAVPCEQELRQPSGLCPLLLFWLL